MTDAIRNVTDATFASEVLESSVPVLVDYWAEWCTPCRMLAPLVDDVAKTYEGKVKVAKIDTDAHPRAASRYHVRSIPTLMLFRDGQPVATSVGVVNRSQLTAFIEENLRKGQSGGARGEAAA